MTKKRNKRVRKERLTPIVRRFCQIVASGIPASRAYRQAYRCPEMDNQTAARKAYELARKGTVKAKIMELFHAMDHKTVLTLNDRVRLLSEDALVPTVTSADRNARARTIQVLNSMSPDRLAEKIEVSTAPGQPIEVTQVRMSPKDKIAALVAAKVAQNAPSP